MTETVHPARSTDFLSRLYDGELGADEGNAFAAHRAECAECREAAEAFAATLAAFRAEPTAPPAADLSARILRKIRAQSPSRRPFGVTFGIDVRWAGVFVAALLVVLLSAPMVLRRAPAVSAIKNAPIAARLVEETPSPQEAPASAGVNDTRARDASETAAPPKAAAAPRALAKDEPVAANAAPAAPPPPSARLEAPADEEKRRVGLAAPMRQRAAAPSRTGEPLGGEAGAGALADVAPANPRLFVLAADGEGTPPPIVVGLQASRLGALRGRAFVLLVETGGRVRSVTMPGSSEPAGAEAQLLREIVFSPGDRPRRLSVRIE